MVDGFSFSASHLIPGHEKCGRLHGHNYSVDVLLEFKELDDKGMGIDFANAKHIIKGYLEQLDHKVMLPEFSPQIKITELISLNNTKKTEFIESIAAGAYTATYANSFADIVVQTLGDNYNIQVNDKFYSIPKSDCIIIPTEFTTAEALSRLFYKELKNLWKLPVSRIDVWETDHSMASYYDVF